MPRSRSENPILGDPGGSQWGRGEVETTGKKGKENVGETVEVFPVVSGFPRHTDCLWVSEDVKTLVVARYVAGDLTGSLPLS